MTSDAVRMRVLELFAGAGGMALGFHRAGFDTVALAEWDDHARCVLKARFPDVPLYGDVTAVDGRQVVASHGRVDLVSGGAPCQDLSVAGKRAGLNGSRSILFYDLIRIWEETGATYCLYENVCGALSSNKGADFAAVLSAFVGAPVAVPRDGWGGDEGGGGVVAGPTGVAAWRVLDAQFFGVPQRRRRVFVLGARPGGVDPAAVLLEWEGMCGDSAPSSEAWEGVARETDGGADGGGVEWPARVACALDTRYGKNYGQEHQHMNQGCALFVPHVVGSLTAKGPGTNGAPEVDAGHILVGQDQDVIAFGSKGSGLDAQTDLAPTLRAGGHKDSHANGGVPVGVVAYDDRNQSVSEGTHHTLRGEGIGSRVSDAIIQGECYPTDTRNATRTTDPSEQNRQGMGVGADGDPCPTITNISGPLIKGPQGSQRNGVVEVEPIPILEATSRASKEVGRSSVGIGKPGDPMFTLSTKQHGVQVGRPRRLLPIECERLMGWPEILEITGSNDDDIRRAIQSVRTQAVAACQSTHTLHEVWEYGDGRTAPPRHFGRSGEDRSAVPSLSRAGARPARGLGAGSGAASDLRGVRFHLPAEAAQALTHLLGASVSEGDGVAFGPPSLGCRATLIGWTAVPDPRGKPMADSHRYKMCGNGVVSYCAEWIGRRLLQCESEAVDVG